MTHNCLKGFSTVHIQYIYKKRDKIVNSVNSNLSSGGQMERDGSTFGYVILARRAKSVYVGQELCILVVNNVLFVTYSSVLLAIHLCRLKFNLQEKMCKASYSFPICRSRKG